jgi:thioredoxin reductase
MRGARLASARLNPASGEPMASSGAQYDVIIVGGGPAGLSAALVLGRCRRRVLVLDDGQPRNAASHAMHGFLSRDGIDPREFARIARAQLAPYRVELRTVEALDAARCRDGFEVVVAGGGVASARRLLLATGLIDVLPEVPGVRELYGRGVVHCPYCDGWEARDQRLAVYGRGDSGIELALHLLTWSSDVLLFTDGGAPDAHARSRLARHRVSVRTERVERVVANDGHLAGVALSGGDTIACDTLFLKMEQRQHSPLAERLGARATPSTGIVTDDLERCGVPGLFIAGDASKDVLLAVVAAAEGARAAFAINAELQSEEFA